MTASVGFVILGSGRSSKRMSRGPYRTVPCMINLLTSLISFITLDGSLRRAHYHKAPIYLQKAPCLAEKGDAERLVCGGCTRARVHINSDRCIQNQIRLGGVGGNGGDVCNVVALSEGWNRVDVQDDTGDGSAGFEYNFAEVVGDKADFHALLNIGTTLHERVPNSRAVGQDIHHFV